MADVWSGQVGNNYCPQIHFVVSLAAGNADHDVLNWYADYVAHGYAAYTNGHARAWSINIDGQVRSGSFNINGQTGAVRLGSGQITVAKAHAYRDIGVSCSMNMDFTWNGAYLGTASGSGAHPIGAKSSYTVSYNANGGSGAPSAQTKWYNENLTLSGAKPTRTGYTFLNWSGSDGKTYNPGSTYSGNGALTLTAKWGTNTYTVTFKDGHSGATLKTQTVNYNTNATPPAPPSRTGYTFAGWNGSYTNVTSNRTITAKWTINKYYIDVNGTLNGEHQSGTAPMGTFDVYINNSLAMNDTADYHQRHNYQTSYRVQDIKANTGYNYTGSSGSALSGTVPANNVSISLNFTTKGYTVSFNANLGEAVSNMPSSFIKTHFVSVKLPSNVPTARRYEFLGWATSAGGEVMYQPGDTYSTEGNATLYAIWKLKASVVRVYQPDGTGRDGICSIYDDAGNHHYAILWVYDGNGNRHEVL